MVQSPCHADVLRRCVFGRLRPPHGRPRTEPELDCQCVVESSLAAPSTVGREGWSEAEGWWAVQGKGLEATVGRSWYCKTGLWQ